MPSGDVSTVPESPTTTFCVPQAAAPLKLTVVPEVRCVQVAPDAGEVRMVPVLPTAMNCVPVQPTPPRLAAVGFVRAVQVTPSGDVWIPLKLTPACTISVPELASEPAAPPTLAAARVQVMPSVLVAKRLLAASVVAAMNWAVAACQTTSLNGVKVPPCRPMPPKLQVRPSVDVGLYPAPSLTVPKRAPDHVTPRKTASVARRVQEVPFGDV